VQKWYVAKIREDIPYYYHHIPDVEKYRGREIRVFHYDGENIGDSFHGRVFNNNGGRYSWSRDCFSEINELV